MEGEVVDESQKSYPMDAMPPINILNPNSRWELDASPECKLFYEMFAGLEFDEEEEKYKKKKGSKPLMTVEGATQLLQYVRSVSNKILFLSNYTEHQISTDLQRFYWDISKEVADFHEKYRIHPAKRKKVVDLIFFYLRACYNKPKDDKERLHRRSSDQRKETIHRYEEMAGRPEKKKFLGLF